MNYSIDPMSIDDYDAVLRLWKRSEGVGLNESDSRRGIASYLERNPGMSFVARAGLEIAGAVLSGHDGRRGYLHHLAVAPAHRRQGLGRKLVAACLKELKKAGLVKCNIFLYCDNSVGERFWLKNGWARRGDLVVVQKNLLRSRKPGAC